MTTLGEKYPDGTPGTLLYQGPLLGKDDLCLFLVAAGHDDYRLVVADQSTAAPGEWDNPLQEALLEGMAVPVDGSTAEIIDDQPMNLTFTTDLYDLALSFRELFYRDADDDDLAEVERMDEEAAG